MSRLAEATTGPAAGSPKRSRSGGAAVLQGVALALGLVLLVGGFATIALDYRPYSVPTGSMEPTIGAGDTVLARAGGGSGVRRGDVVVFHDQTWGSDKLVKRVVGVGGDKVVCCDAQGQLTVNGTSIDEPYLQHTVLPGIGAALASSTTTAATPFSVTVPPGRLFVLGDNRVGSLDSRVHLDELSGTVATSDVLGRVEATVWPLPHAGLLAGTSAFDPLGGAGGDRNGPLEPAGYAMLVGAALIVLLCLADWVVGRARRLRR
ncbi:signal peptidase I [Kitasatospora sp. MAP12-15]|uniref:signal peptidase I n=1 Tax=unclassified Kitasatospora TaxID=2633591 RepID=UPI0024737EFC|nr:signal peptidase I [Kitasatospora sp. MAP12-44]MDH6113023.1 signal peptidase I [Kitasatospora sp. MAP12-44]